MIKILKSLFVFITTLWSNAGGILHTLNKWFLSNIYVKRNATGIIQSKMGMPPENIKHTNNSCMTYPNRVSNLNWGPVNNSSKILLVGAFLIFFLLLFQWENLSLKLVSWGNNTFAACDMTIVYPTAAIHWTPSSLNLLSLTGNWGRPILDMKALNGSCQGAFSSIGTTTKLIVVNMKNVIIFILIISVMDLNLMYSDNLWIAFSIKTFIIIGIVDIMTKIDWFIPNCWN